MSTFEIRRSVTAALVSLYVCAACGEPAPPASSQTATQPAQPAPPPAQPASPSSTQTAQPAPPAPPAAPSDSTAATAAAPATPAAPPTPATPAAPATPTVATTTVGPLELSPAASMLKLVRVNTSTCAAATLHIKMKNASAADVNVALLLAGFSAIDNTGESLLPSNTSLLRTTGVTPVETMPREGLAKWVAANAGSLTTLSPGQVVDVQLAPGNMNDWRYLVCTVDPNADQFHDYRPTTYSMTGTLAVADANGNTQVRPFSISDVPLQVVAK